MYHIATATPELNPFLPTIESLSRIVQRSRALSSGSANFAEAKTAAEFVLPPTCTTTNQGDSFVLFDGITELSSRIILFCTPRNLETLCQYSHWICDGTFYIAPKIFSQSYSFHAIIDGKCVPLIYALLEDKKQTTYTFLLTLLKHYLPELSVGTVMVDFELAVMKAFGTVFPEFSVRNCFFHLCQSVQKYIFKKFKILYYSNKDFARASRLVVFLSFVPKDSIDAAFEALELYIAEKYPVLQYVVNYFELNYLGLFRIESDCRAAAKFPMSFWNHYDSILKDCNFPRTSK